MYTSVTEKSRRRVLKHAAGELGFALFCALFGMIYEVFSHEVYSYYMIYAFMFPLGAGAALLIMSMRKKPPQRKFLNVFNAASATLALGSIATGVVRIYGSSNSLLKVYPAAGALILLLAVFFFITEERDEAPAQPEEMPPVPFDAGRH